MKTRLMQHPTYWQMIWKKYCKYPLGVSALMIVAFFVCVGIYAPLLASSKPLVVQFQGQWYFPLFRYLFYPRFFTKNLDIFYNLLMFTLPLFLIARTKSWLLITGLIQITLFLFLIFYPLRNPAVHPILNTQRQKASLNWQAELQSLPPYAQLNLVLRYQQYKEQHEKLKAYENAYQTEAKRRGQTKIVFPTLWNLTYQQDNEKVISEKAKNQYLQDRQAWLEQQELHYKIMPLVRSFHWEDDAGGDQILNQFVGYWDLTRVNGKDMVAALLFGTRVSLSVGLLAIGLALLIGIPIGAFAGYYGGKFDLIIYRLIEIWESMPTFFMLLMIVAFLQNKSIFIVIAIIGLFGWTNFSRFTRAEFLRQKQLLYTEACQSLGYHDRIIIFSHLLPNAIPPLLTLIPFAIMGAITSEAGLSFLGLGEEGSTSWGVLMDEGRSAFPSESYLLWPPAIFLTILLVAIAIVGDHLRDALDPKIHV